MSVGDLGEMPSSGSLMGLPVVSCGQSAIRGSTISCTTQGTLGISTSSTTADTSTTWLRLGTEPSLPQLPQRTQGVYVGAGNSPVSSKLADRIRRWEFIDMADLLPEVRLSDREGEAEKLLQKRPRCVTDIWSWLHCFGTYVSVLGPFYPQAIPELMAYMSLIIRCSQDYEGLAWVRYDMSFRRQAAASGNRNWSEVNSTLYSVCFTGKSRRNLQCELCLAKSHTTNNCPLQGECTDRQLGVSFQRGTATSSGGWRQLPPSGEVCKLWNHNQCRYSRCRHTHVCMRCGGNHPVVVCNLGLRLGDQ